MGFLFYRTASWYAFAFSSGSVFSKWHVMPTDCRQLALCIAEGALLSSNPCTLLSPPDLDSEANTVPVVLNSPANKTFDYRIEMILFRWRHETERQLRYLNTESRRDSYT
jgi:hypothetical protein